MRNLIMNYMRYKRLRNQYRLQIFLICLVITSLSFNILSTWLSFSLLIMLVSINITIVSLILLVSFFVYTGRYIRFKDYAKSYNKMYRKIDCILNDESLNDNEVMLLIKEYKEN